MRIVLFANTDWYLYNFRRSFACYLRDQGFDVILVSPAGEYGARLREMGFHWEPIPMERRSLNPLAELRLVIWLARFIVRERICLIHGFTIKCAVYAALAARLAGGCASVSAVAGMGYVFTSESAKARALRPLVRGLLKIALDGSRSRLILQNPDDVSLFVSHGLVDGSRIRLIPGSGVDCAGFAPRPEDEGFGGPARRFRVLLAARLLWDKGLAEYIAAARVLRACHGGLEFLLAGSPDPGNPASVSEELVGQWHAEGVVTWLGHVDKMPALLGTVDLVVLPSYREGLPKGLIEAAACALPIVTTDVPGCREVIRNEESGILVPVKDSVALASAIERLYADPPLRRRLGLAARRRALEEFDEKIVLRRTLDVYRELGVVPAGASVE